MQTLSIDLRHTHQPYSSAPEGWNGSGLRKLLARRTAWSDTDDARQDVGAADGFADTLLNLRRSKGVYGGHTP